MISHLRVALEYFKINIKTFMEYRANFFIQIISMGFNDLIWIIFWFFFFANFITVNGYTFNDMAIIYGLAATIYGLSGIFANNTRHLGSIINEGKLDYYLTLPKNVLFHLSTSGMSAFSIGDLIFGSILLYIFLPHHLIPLTLLFIISGIVLLVSFDLIASSLSFFIGNSSRLITTIHNATVTFAIYPIGIFADPVKLILLTIIPVGFIGAIPLEIIKKFSIELLGLTFLASFIVLLISIGIFYLGLRRYESGNLLYVRS